MRRIRIVRRHPCRVVLLLKVHQLGITFTPELVTLLPGPFEPKFIEKVDAGLTHVGGLLVGKEFVLLLLSADPSTELLVLVVLLGDVAVSVGGMESFKFLL